MIQFLLNQQLISEQHLDPNMTVLNYLRRHQRRCGTKEGCASGDCGACTVTLAKVVAGELRYETINSCLTLVSTLQGKQLITVEDLKQGAQLHSVQQAMVACHASQCGFCTPGFVMSLFTLQKNSQHWDRHQCELALAGNLCRCTGYRPIIAAAQQAGEDHAEDSFDRQQQSVIQRLLALENADVQEITGNNHRCLLPKTLTQLAELYQQYPDAQLLAGGTDLALQITQRYQTLPLIIALEQVEELKRCEITERHIMLGAGASLSHCWQLLSAVIPAFAAILERFASLQIRNQGTLGGNIANGSPIGDAPPMLLALDASLILQCGDRQRSLPLDQFFLSYRKTALQPGEFIRSIVIPRVTTSQNFQAWKVSKRLEDDISAVFAAFTLAVEDQIVVSARIAFGGMAETARRASACEQQLIGQPVNSRTLENACRALEQDFQPIDDFRASAAYRLQLAKNLLRRYYHHLSGELTVTEVSRYVS